MRVAGLDLTRKEDGRALPRLPHVAMFPPPVVVPPCSTPVPTVAVATPVATATPQGPPTGAVPAADGRVARSWRYILKFDLPSRIAVMKNALGDEVRIIPSYTPPAFDLASRAGFRSGEWADTANTITIRSIKDTNKWRMSPPYGAEFTTEEINPDCTPGPGIVPGCNTWEFTLTFPPNVARGDPGRPADVLDVTTGLPTAGTWEERAPANIIGGSATDVNWGLLAYSAIAADTCNNYDGTASNELITAIDPLGTDVSTILAKMRLARDGGLRVGGGTPTRSALEKAQQHLIDTFAIDPLYQCLRTYGVILVTDGESNTCNAGPTPNREWGFAGEGANPPNAPCPGAQGPPTPAWPNYPPGISDDIWNLELTTPCVGKPPRDPAFGPINPRTWVIGFGSEVGKCELNYTAFKGRTDASAPLNDTGFDWINNTPRLCGSNNGDPTASPPVPGTECLTDAVYDDSQDYAFFADDTRALVNAFEAIRAATAKGDYATGAPVQGPVSGAAQGRGDFVILSSTSYPGWEGHLYKFDATKYKPDGNHLPGYRLWDAAAILRNRDQSASPRRILTWDPTTLNLVEVNAASLATLQAIEPSLDAEIVDFIRGFDGTLSGKKRDQVLGPLINTVPSIVAAPNLYRQSNLAETASHKQFETDYQDRRVVIWIGSNDGMLHAFDFDTGDEHFAILPPQLLGTQGVLYENFKDAGRRGTGQPVGFENIYGVAGSLRFGDVFFEGGSGGQWRTLGLMTLAGGGELLAAIDITHPWAEDPADSSKPRDLNYGSFPRGGDLANAPVQVVWQKTSADLPGLGKTWSLPALGPRSADKWSINFGAGYDTGSTYGSPKRPHLFLIDPVDGSPVGAAPSVDVDLATGAWVGNQTFADGVRIDHKASGFASDNIATRAIQADLNGRIWFFNTDGLSAAGPDSPIVGIDASAVGGTGAQSQPIYYPPAAGGLGPVGNVATGCNLYTFGSGTFYEKSTRVNGPETGSTGFQPSLYFAANEKTRSTETIDPDKILQIPIKLINRPERSTTSTDRTDYGATLSRFSQLVAAPFLLIDPKGITDNVGIFVIYDPTVGCNGASYAVTVRWKLDDCAPPLTVSSGTSHGTGAAGGAVVEAFFAGEGAASGLTAVGERVFTGIAGLGSGQADLFGISESAAIGPGVNFRPIWWKELK